MPLLDRLKGLRAALCAEQYRYFWAGIFCLFLCSIFITANVRVHRNIYYLLVIPFFLLQAPASFFYSLLRSPVFQASLAYLVYLWLSLFWSSASTPYTFYNEARTLAIMLSFLAITAFYSSTVHDFTVLLGKCLAWIAGPAALISIAWFYSNATFARWGGLDSRVVDIGLAGHPIDSAVTYGLAAVFLVFTLLAPRRESVHSSWPYAGSLLAILTFIGLTQTRGVILSIALVVFLGAAAMQKNKRLLMVLGALAAVSLGIIALSVHHPEGMVGFDRRFAVRWEIWQVALELAKERLWFGFGLNEHQTLHLSHGGFEGVAHSLYLENLLFGGLAGTLLLLILLGVAIRRAWLEFRRNGDFLLPALMLFPIMSGISTGYLTLSKIAPEWIQIWLPIGLIIGSEARRQGVHAHAHGKTTH